MYENIGLILGIALAAFLFNVVINAVFLWIASKILKLEKQDFLTSLRTTVIYILLSIVLLAVAFVPSFLIPGGSLITMLLLILMCFIELVLYVYLIKNFYEVDWKTAVLAFVIVIVASTIVGAILYGLLFFGVVFWQLGVFNAGQGNMVVTGFVKMQPLTPSVAYSGSKFTASFTNALGASVRITDLRLKESISGTDCSVEPLEGQTIRPGGTFTLKADCGQKNAGDAYDLAITISYSDTMGGITTTHTETGHIKGQAETGHASDDAAVYNGPAENKADSTKTTTGFVRMQPLEPSIAYRGSKYTAAFTNTIGSRIKITDVSVKESITGTDCSVDQLETPSVSAGGIFTIKGECGQKNEGESYDLAITISYDVTLGGITASRADTGHITGQAETGTGGDDVTDYSSEAVKTTSTTATSSTITTLSNQDYCSSGWSYKVPVTLENPGPGLADYQVKLVVPYNSRMKSDFSDVRFTGSDGSTVLSYWIEDYASSGSANFWVKVGAVPSGSSTIYMYYGDPSASSSSSGDNTFIFFDDFSGSRLSALKWVSGNDGEGSSVTVSGGYLRLQTPSGGGKYYVYASTRNLLSLPLSVEARVRASSGDCCHGFTGTGPAQSTTYDAPNMMDYSRVSILPIVNDFNVNGFSVNSSTIPADTWVRYSVKVSSGASNCTIGSSTYFNNQSFSDSSEYLKLNVRKWYYSNGIYDWDWVAVRNYASKEPTASKGPEQSCGR